MDKSDNGDARDGPTRDPSAAGPVTTDDDPRNISDQSLEHSAEARGAEMELSPDERRDQVKSAAPEGGEIQDVPAEPGRESERDAERERSGREGGDGRGSRVSLPSRRRRRRFPRRTINPWWGASRRSATTSRNLGASRNLRETSAAASRNVLSQKSKDFGKSYLLR